MQKKACDKVQKPFTIYKTQTRNIQKIGIETNLFNLTEVTCEISKDNSILAERKLSVSLWDTKSNSMSM